MVENLFRCSLKNIARKYQWITKAFRDNYVFTQDGCHSFTRYDTGFRDKNMWPPSSIDVNPMDFVISRKRSFKGILQTINALKKSLVASGNRLCAEVVRYSCESVLGLFRATVKVKCEHIE